MTNQERKEKRYIRRKQAREAKRRSKNQEFDNFYSFANPIKLKEAFNKCRKNVGWKNSTQLFKQNILINILKAFRTLNNGKAVSLGFKEFTINERGKKRNIKSTHICERMVQRSLCDNVLNPILTKTLIYDNGACLKGKGITFSRKRIVKHLSEFYKKNKDNGYILLMDYSKYFDLIDHKVLTNNLHKYIKDEKVFSICEQYINSFGEKGLGLGSQISQILAVFFVNPIDHFIKNNLGIKYYGRYMDDSYILSNNKDELKEYLIKINKKCKENGITINLKKTKIIKLKAGFEFLQCKYHYGKNGKIIKCGGRKSAKRFRRRLRMFKNNYYTTEENKIYIKNCYKSWMGGLKYFNSRKIINNMNNLFNSLFPDLLTS